MSDFKFCPICGNHLEDLTTDTFDPGTGTHKETFYGYTCECGYEDILDEYADMHEEAKWL
jgi:hypothetical protein